MRNIHITKHADGWQAKEAKTVYPLAVFQKQSDAIKLGATFAKASNSELFVHGRDGKIRERNTFGNDPFPPRG